MVERVERVLSSRSMAWNKHFVRLAGRRMVADPIIHYFHYFIISDPIISHYFKPDVLNGTVSV